ncbi:hypothetical protein COW36_22140 [bacterium (Candidatus Blackallbacteria) CG17_big_fil_post_rev_8_21_14_2_50_48_46]|uniref:AB hydrolase-1 domain-containing protein n=1 Tax=bacterium (Candidatus Blackallbacteria) CG17_big_fil_post_rev_8_21_14_2_50_48_46 TaxID=2014261 RepID=A0A2M7FYQ2_9BACT|nr:MAG: hypothetical protein COW64_13570 [bacterium (Candidatus Blackallbacteria) CG18_big_fil_WC_8_21_14_2_50_49_26]PIW14319.1 MAG: hypothetical protein COW36_22140 [bacterium (Candidatus Blackallbacteria) CG17_big_fil_post_rev_8_21_14_2_50_48_46]PIW45588.1 MAG: hypothetical protein COW20_19745 [bacterium (Candidatus Blackallbacteria) CG13_big_fil_rev_8_21_14_2_50_49_14]
MRKFTAFMFWARELFELLKFIVLIPFSWFWQAPQVKKSFSNRAQIVLVPGFLGRGLEFLPLKRKLEKAGFEVFIAQLGFQASQIQTKGQRLAEFLEAEQIENATLLGYSLGGWISLQLPEKARWRVKTLITLGVAFRGTPMAILLSPLKAARQLIPGSSFLKQAHSPWLHFPNHFNFYAQRDEITASQRTSQLKGIQEHVLPVQGHLNLICHPLAQKELVAQLIQTETALNRGGNCSELKSSRDKILARS